MIGKWWHGLAPREMILIAIAAVLSVIIGGWFFVISPVLSGQADAKRDLERVMTDKILVDRALARIGPGLQATLGPADSLDIFRADVTRAAQARGLQISRIQSGEGGTLQLTFNEAAPREIFAWLDEVSRKPGGAVVRANITSRDAAVQAVIELNGVAP